MRDLSGDAWIVGLTAYPATIALSVMYLSLAKKQKDNTVVSYAQHLMGKIPGNILGLLIILFLIQVGAYNLRDYAELLVRIMPNTPITVFSALTILLSILALKAGIESLGRLSEILFLLTIAIFFVGILINIPHVNLTELLPVFDNGYSPVIKSSLLQFTFTGNLFFLLFILPKTSDRERAQKSLSYALIVSGAMFIITTVFVLAVLGRHENYRVTYKLFEVFRYAYRIEGLFIFMWIANAFFKVSLLFYSITVGLGEMLGVKEYKVLYYPLGVIIVSLSLLSFPTFSDYLYHVHFVTPIYSLPLEIGIPFLLIGLSLFKSNKKQTPQEP